MRGAASRLAARPRALAAAAAAAVAGICAGVLLVAPAIDPLTSLAWGSVLADGTRPDLQGPTLPLPHPLSILVSALLSVPGPDAAYAGLRALAGLLFVALVYSVFRLTRALTGSNAGAAGLAAAALAALLLATRPPIEFIGLRAMLDVPFALLVVGALALVVERPARSPWLPLSLLALAGLLRPEAWALALLYAGWLAFGGARGRALAAVFAVALAAPALWLAFDLAISGDPLNTAKEATSAGTEEEHSGFTVTNPGTPHKTEPGFFDEDGELDRAALHVRSLLGVTLSIAALAALAWALLPDRRGPPELLLGRRIAAVAALAIAATLEIEKLAGAPVIERYSLGLVAILLALVFALAAGLPRRWLPAAAIAVIAIAVVAEQPRQFKVLYKQAKSSTKLQDQQLDAAWLSDQRVARGAIRRCPRVMVGGVGREVSLMGRAIVAMHLGRDPVEVELRRVPRGPRSSDFRHLLRAGPPPRLERGYWTFRSKCLTSRRGSSPSGA